MEFKLCTQEYEVSLVGTGNVASFISLLQFMAALDAFTTECHSELEGRVVLQRWFRSQGVSESGIRKVVLLCDHEYLLAQRRPPSWNRQGNFGQHARLRYFWYRYAARLLGWCERKQFPPFIRDILRLQIFPSASNDDEENGSSTGTAAEDQPRCPILGRG